MRRCCAERRTNPTQRMDKTNNEQHSRHTRTHVITATTENTVAVGIARGAMTRHSSLLPLMYRSQTAR